MVSACVYIIAICDVDGCRDYILKEQQSAILAPSNGTK